MAIGALQVQIFMPLMDRKPLQKRMLAQRNELVVGLEVGMALQTDLIVYVRLDDVKLPAKVGNEALRPFYLGNYLPPETRVRVAIHTIDIAMPGILPRDIHRLQLMAGAASRGTRRVIKPPYGDRTKEHHDAWQELRVGQRAAS